MFGSNPWLMTVCRRSFSSLSPRSLGLLQGARGCLMGACAVRVAVVVFYGYPLWVRLLAGECPFCRGRLTQGHVRWVTSGYCVKPGGEPCVVVRGGGGGTGVVVSGNEVKQLPWGLKGRRIAVAAHAWCALVIVPHG